jgi:hypothetical protein
VALLASKLKVSSGHVTVELRCDGGGLCAGTLRLSVKHKSAGRHRKRTTTQETIGQANFTILPEMSASVSLSLNASGKALLAGGRGKLKALLEVLGAESSSDDALRSTSQRLSRSVHLSAATRRAKR